MGLYIKGMKIPENCMECDIVAEDDDGPYCPFTKVMALNIGIQDNCPLVEIQEPHGRLIDADKLYATVQSNENADAYVRFLLRHSSTVIEAEGN